MLVECGDPKVRRDLYGKDEQGEPETSPAITSEDPPLPPSNVDTDYVEICVNIVEKESDM